MPALVMLTRLNPDAVRSPKGLEALERDAMKRVRAECPGVEWLSSYAVLGPYDYLDVFKASIIETAAKVSALIRTFGHAQTEIWTATELPISSSQNNDNFHALPTMENEREPNRPGQNAAKRPRREVAVGQG